MRTVLLAVAFILATHTTGIVEHERVSRLTAPLGNACGFERNVGQFDSAIRFLARTPHATIAFTDAGPQIRGAGDPSTAFTWAHGQRPAAHVLGVEPLRARINHLTGRDPRGWHVGVPTFARVEYQDVAPGVDIVYRAHPDGLEFDVVVAPGADPRAAHLTFNTPVALDGAGDLHVGSGSSALLLRAPTTYQEDTDGRRLHVDARFVVRSSREVGFAVGPHDPSRAVVIDPVVVASALIGSSFSDDTFAVATDKEGAMYVAGVTYGNDFPVVHPLQTGPGGDGFIAKFSADGTQLLFSTYFGGNGGFNTIADIAVDGAGAMYVAGSTEAPDLPIANAAQPSLHGDPCTPDTVGQYKCGDAFVAKISADGSALVYSTYLGGTGTDHATSIAVDRAGHAYVGGFTYGADFPLVNAADPTFMESSCGATPCDEGFVTKLASNGATFEYSTFVGGRGFDAVSSIAVDDRGRASFAGETTSDDLPVVHAFQPACYMNASAFNPCSDAIVGRLAPSGSAFQFLTYLGGEHDDVALGVAVAGESAYVTGYTNSRHFPTRNPIQPTLSEPAPPGSCTLDDMSAPACNDVFVAKLTEDGGALVFSTYLGGPSTDDASGIAVDSRGNVSVAGETTSRDFPVVRAYQRGFGAGSVSAFVAMLSPDGRLRASTFVGTNSQARAVAVDRQGHTIVTGNVVGIPSVMFPAFPASYQMFQQAHEECRIYPFVGRVCQTLPGHASFAAKLLPLGAGGILIYDAGTGQPGGLTDGRYGTMASLVLPFQVAVDSFGNRFVADGGSNSVFRIGLDNVVARVAGTGSNGFSGDGGNALSATLSGPTGVAVDAAGNMYISDTHNNRIRMVDASTHVIRTIAGNGVPGFSGDGGPATAASLAAPGAVAVVAGHVYIADTYNNRIRDVDWTGRITTVAGSGAPGNDGDGGPATLAQLNTPTGVAVDGEGRLLIACWGGHTVRRISNGVIETLAGTGSAGYSGDEGAATAGQLNGPFGVAVDAAGRVFITDELNHRVRMITPDGTIHTVAGNGVPGSHGIGGNAREAELTYPVGIAADRFDNLFISDPGDHRAVLRVFRYSATLP